MSALLATSPLSAHDNHQITKSVATLVNKTHHVSQVATQTHDSGSILYNSSQSSSIVHCSGDIRDYSY